MYKHMLVATDGSDVAGKAVEHALGLAKAVGAKVTVLTVTPPWSALAFGMVQGGCRRTNATTPRRPSRHSRS